MRRWRRRRDHDHRTASGHLRPGRPRPRAAARRRRAGGRSPSDDRRLRPARLRHPASRRPPGPVRGRADRPGRGRTRRRARLQAVPRRPRPDHDPRAASRACSRSPSRPITGSRASCTSTTPTPPAIRGWSSTAALRRIPWSPTRRAPARSWAWTSRTRTTTVASSCSGRTSLLYIGLGDGGSEDDPQRRGQDLSTLLAKILRIDPRPSGGRPYSVPKSNPFVGRSGARPEIYSYGLRNPWRFSFDLGNRGPGDRRRGPKRVRGGRPGRPGQGLGCELRLVGL